MGSIVVVGGGGHAKVLLSVIRRLSWSIVGYSDAQDRGPLLGVRRLGGDDVLPRILDERPGCAVAIGVGKVDASPVRLELLDAAVALGFAAPAVLSPEAVVNEDVEVGSGSMVFDGAVVNSGTLMGRACIVNTNATVEHDCTLGDDVHVAPGVTVCGGVTIGRHTMIGAGATVLPGLTICDGCLVGAGSLVTHDLRLPGVYLGAPASPLL